MARPRKVWEILDYLKSTLHEGDIVIHKGRRKGEKNLTEFYTAVVEKNKVNDDLTKKSIRAIE